MSKYYFSANRSATQDVLLFRFRFLHYLLLVVTKLRSVNLGCCLSATLLARTAKAKIIFVANCHQNCLIQKSVPAKLHCSMHTCGGCTAALQHVLQNASQHCSMRSSIHCRMQCRMHQPALQHAASTAARSGHCSMHCN